MSFMYNKSKFALLQGKEKTNTRVKKTSGSKYKKDLGL